MNEILNINNLGVSFEFNNSVFRATSNVSFNLYRGQTLGIVGESGSGKSVTAKSIMKLLPSTAVFDDGSEIIYKGTNIINYTDKEMEKIRGKEIGMIFQDPMSSLNPTMRIGDQICENIIKHQHLNKNQAKDEAIKMLELVGIKNPELRITQFPHEFSGGMRQRAMIALALASKPSILIADEPTTALDVTIQAQILRLIKDIQKQLNISVILITHDLGIVAGMCDDIIVMKDGLIVEKGSTNNIFYKPENDYTKNLLNSLPNILDKKEKSSKKISKDPLICVENLKQYFSIGKGDYIKAVDNISFDIFEGETLGFVGESGSGKSTTGRSILQLNKPTSGTIKYKGFNLVDLTNRELKEMRKYMQIIFQDPYASLDPRLKIIDIIGEALDVHKICKNKSDRLKRVQELLEMVGLNPDFAIRFPHEFSGGQRQRIGIARALAVNPSFIVCDEPLSALDASIQIQVVNLLEDLQKKLGLTYLFIAHDLSMVKKICDRVAVMCNGKLVELAETEELYSNPIHPYTKKLLNAIPVADPLVEANRYDKYEEITIPSIDSNLELFQVNENHWVIPSN